MFWVECRAALPSVCRHYTAWTAALLAHLSSTPCVQLLQYHSEAVNTAGFKHDFASLAQGHISRDCSHRAAGPILPSMLRAWGCRPSAALEVGPEV